MKDARTDDNGYLWDRSGEPDAEVERLESLLAPLRHRGLPPVLPARRRRMAPPLTPWTVREFLTLLSKLSKQ